MRKQVISGYFDPSMLFQYRVIRDRELAPETSKEIVVRIMHHDP